MTIAPTVEIFFFASRFFVGLVIFFPVTQLDTEACQPMIIISIPPHNYMYNRMDLCESVQYFFRKRAGNHGMPEKNHANVCVCVCARARACVFVCVCVCVCVLVCA